MTLALRTRRVSGDANVTSSACDRFVNIEGKGAWEPAESESKPAGTWHLEGSTPPSGTNHQIPAVADSMHVGAFQRMLLAGVSLIEQEQRMMQRQGWI